MLRAFSEARLIWPDDYRAVLKRMPASFLQSVGWERRFTLQGRAARFNDIRRLRELRDGLFALYELTLDYKWLETACRCGPNDRSVLGIRKRGFLTRRP